LGEPLSLRDTGRSQEKFPENWDQKLFETRTRFVDGASLCELLSHAVEHVEIPIPALHTYSADESFLEVGAGSLFRGPGLGSWEHTGNHQFTARFKFFLFKPDGSPRGDEVVTNHIELTGPDTFEASANFVRAS